jgi:hypothetical protein
MAGGGLPSGSTVVLLALLSTTLGAMVASTRRSEGFSALVSVLALGQLMGHVLLGAAGHSHQPAGAGPLGLMVAAHVVAIAFGAALIAAGGRLCAAVSRSVVSASRPPRRPIVVRLVTVVRSADQPLQSARLLSTSLSHRGPPVGFAH